MELNEAKSLACALIVEHNLSEWGFYFDNSINRFGCCHYDEKRISLSEHLTLLNDHEKVKNTILHEIAHALAPKYAHHNEEWRKIALKIGCDGSRCYSSDVVRPPAKYKTICPNCNKEGRANRNNKSACGKCCNKYNFGRYSKEYSLKYIKNEVTQ